MMWLLLVLALVVAFLANLFIGAVNIDPTTVIDIITGKAASNTPESYIVMQSRLPAAISAVLAGSGLAVAGLLLQTSFRNPLAGPSILGINSGASLGVAIVMLFAGGTITAGTFVLEGELAVIAGAIAGSFLIMAILLALSAWLKNNLMLLIAGILVGYLTSSIITILNFSASTDGVHSYVMWGMGSFNNVPMSRMPCFIGLTLVGLIISFLLVKPLDLLLLGDNYARNLGVNIGLLRRMLLLSTGLLVAAATAYCGPVSFIGLAIPHVARFLTRTDTHRRLLPVSLITGAVVALLCNIICVLPSSLSVPWISSSSMLPLNSVTPLFGVPVILYVILKRS